MAEAGAAMTRKTIAMGIVLMALGLWLVSGCTAGPDPQDNNLDQYAFEPMHKQDKNCEWGKKAAVYQEQIYYSDPANGGIFRMNLDGSQCQLFLEGPDIRKLQFTPQGLYYLGFVGNASNDTGEYRSFGLFVSHWGARESQSVMKAPPDVMDPEAHLELWDFYLSQEGTLAKMHVGWAGLPFSYPIFSLCYASAGEEIPKGRLTILRDFPLNRQQQVPGSKYPGRCEVGAYDGLFYSAESRFVSIGPDSEHYDLACGSFSVTDLKRNQVVLDTAAAPNRAKASQHRTIDGFCPDGVLVRIKNEMMLMTGDFQRTVRSVLLEGEEAIRFVVAGGDAAYLIAENGSENRQQSVYRLDLGTFACQKLYTCAQSEKFLWIETKEEERVLWLDAEKLVTAQGKTLRVWTLENGGYTLNRTLETKENMVANSNKTDVAGDWLFVYRFNEKENRDELVEKINIAAE